MSLKLGLLHEKGGKGVTNRYEGVTKVSFTRHKGVTVTRLCHLSDTLVTPFIDIVTPFIPFLLRGRINKKFPLLENRNKNHYKTVTKPR